MEKIKVGEYVRTENGEIHKVEDIEDLRIHIETEKIMFRSWVDDYYGCHKEDRFIVKHSPNIIDLIEEGDYVNGERVFATENRINDNGEKVILVENYNEWTDDGVIANKDIKSVITKEQIESIKYEV